VGEKELYPEGIHDIDQKGADQRHDNEGHLHAQHDFNRRKRIRSSNAAL
jgi:hypothetical protein